MRSCYESPAYFQVGWSSLQTGSRRQCNRHRVVRVQTGSLENLEPQIASEMCSKNLQTTPNCGSWANRDAISVATEHHFYGKPTVRPSGYRNRRELAVSELPR